MALNMRRYSRKLKVQEMERKKEKQFALVLGGGIVIEPSHGRNRTAEEGKEEENNHADTQTQRNAIQLGNYGLLAMMFILITQKKKQQARKNMSKQKKRHDRPKLMHSMNEYGCL